MSSSADGNREVKEKETREIGETQVDAKGEKVREESKPGAPDSKRTNAGIKKEEQPNGFGGGEAKVKANQEGKAKRETTAGAEVSSPSKTAREMKKIEGEIEDTTSPLFKEQQDFLESDKDYMKVKADKHLGLLFRSIDVDLGPEEKVVLSSQIVRISIKGMDAKDKNAKPKSATAALKGMASADSKAFKDENEGDDKNSGHQRTPDILKPPSSIPDESIAKSQQEAVEDEDEVLGTLVVTQYALYVFPPAMEIDEKMFLVYNVYERYMLQDLIMITRPYRNMRSEDGDEYAFRSNDLVLHWKRNKHLWLRPPKSKGVEVAEVLSHLHFELTGIRLTIQSSDSVKLTDMIMNKKIKDQMDDVLIEYWGTHELVMQGWLWHYSYSRARSEEPVKMTKKINWKRQWFSLSSDNTLLRFDSPEKMAGFRAQAASLNLLPVFKKKELREYFHSNRIDLMDADVRNMPSQQNPGGFEVMVDTQWHLDSISGPITHHLFIPPGEDDRRRGSAIRKLFPSIDIFRNRSRSVSKGLASPNSWIHAVFRRVQVAQYGLKRAKAQAKAYTTNFYIRSKRTLGDRPPVPTGPPPEGSKPQLISYDLSKPGTYVLMKVPVPVGKGYTEGNKLMFLTPEDKKMLVTIPSGISEGEEFVVKVPKAALMASGIIEPLAVNDKDQQSAQSDLNSPGDEPAQMNLEDFLGSEDETGSPPQDQPETEEKNGESAGARDESKKQVGDEVKETTLEGGEEKQAEPAVEHAQMPKVEKDAA